MAPDSGPGSPGDAGLVTITVRRSHLFALGGLAVGFVFGLLTAAVTLRPEGADSMMAMGPPMEFSDPAPAPSPPAPLESVRVEGRPFKGDPDAAVTVVEFTDYQCPFCRRHFAATLPALLEGYGDRIRYVVRNFPIAVLHPDAEKAAEAAECALDQDRFWAYHDRLFAEEALGVSDLKRYATELGLDRARFDACLDGGAMRGVVEMDLRDGVRHGVTGTPTFFVNGRMIEGAMGLEVIGAAIEASLEEGSP